MELNDAVNQVLSPKNDTSADPDEQAALSLAAKIASVEGLRPFPVVAQKVMATLNDPNYKVSTIVRLVKEDPSLATNVMRLANSAFFFRGKAIDSINKAIVRLGHSTLKEVVCSVAMMEMFPDVKGMGQSIRDHLAATAALAQELVRDLLPSFVDGAFLCGLVHDLGKLLLIESGELLYKSGDPIELTTPDRAHVKEHRVLGYDHGVLGGQILWNWRFPEPIPQVVAWHHHPALAYQHKTVDYLTAILRIADHVDFYIKDDSFECEHFLEQFSDSDDFAFAGVSEEYMFEKWAKLRETRAESLALFS